MAKALVSRCHFQKTQILDGTVELLVCEPRTGPTQNAIAQREGGKTPGQAPCLLGDTPSLNET